MPGGNSSVRPSLLSQLSVAVQTTLAFYFGVLRFGRDFFLRGEN